MIHRFPWNDQAASRLKDLWLGNKAQDIADILTCEFGNVFTRHAVVAQARRYELPHKRATGVQKSGEKPAPAKVSAAKPASVKPALRYIKRSAEQKGFQPVRFAPAIIVEPTKEQLAADKKLIEDHIATKGVTLCETATFIPLNHDFNRVARPMKGI